MASEQAFTCITQRGSRMQKQVIDGDVILTRHISPWRIMGFERVSARPNDHECVLKRGGTSRPYDVIVIGTSYVI